MSRREYSTRYGFGYPLPIGPNPSSRAFAGRTRTTAPPVSPWAGNGHDVDGRWGRSGSIQMSRLKQGPHAAGGVRFPRGSQSNVRRKGCNLTRRDVRKWWLGPGRFRREGGRWLRRLRGGERRVRRRGERGWSRDGGLRRDLP